MSAPDLDIDSAFDRPLSSEEVNSSTFKDTTPERTIVMPVPVDAPRPSFRHRDHGSPSTVWTYRDKDGAIIGYICRFDVASGGKEILPYTLWHDVAGQMKWLWKSWPAPRPLYGLDRLNLAADALVIVTESEKTADAAGILFPAGVAITSPAGAFAADQADWSPLRGRKVLIVPDANDAPDPKGHIPGQVYAEAVAAQAHRHGASEILILDTAALSRRLPDGTTREGPVGWDLADALAEGWTAETLQALIHGDPSLCKPVDPQEPPRHAEPSGFFSHGPFRMDAVRGLWMGAKRGEAVVPLFICAPFEVLGRVRTPNGLHWARLLRWSDDDGRVHTHAVPDAELHGDARALAASLATKGLRIATGKGPALLAAYLNGVTCETRVTQVERTGWHEIGGKLVFVLPERSIGAAAAETVTLSRQGPTPYETAGSLEDWRNGVGRLASGQSRLMLAISAAFAGVLLKIAKLDGGGVNLYGASSTGKSTAIEAAASVWGRGASPGFVRSWRATANALEGAAALHNDNVLVLDELGVVEAKEAAAATYQLAAGTGKGRSARDGSLRSPLTWRTLVLSTGEIRLSDKLRENGRRAMAGQAIRLIDVPADAGKNLGIFDHAGELGSAKALADAIKLAARTHYGSAGPAFLAQLIEQGLEDVEAAVSAAIAQFQSKVVPQGADGQVQRAGDRFGLIAAAGELARDFGLVPWDEGSATESAAVCFQAWLLERGGTGAAEADEAIARVRRFIEAHGQSRFEDLGETLPSGRILNRAGYRQGQGTLEQWLVLPETWKAEVCVGLDPSRAARILADRGMLLRAQDGFQTVRKIANRSTRVYALTAKILAGGEGE